ncbi:MAG: hypothetical protein HeimC2_03720 [Candidatus Heimdallarchaeota archaeon LC_2]|nr:MAG: hypothetical protein HeimC2_03720 [Candidatus Heimdallarchaeota archaeon LC_2]
MGNKKFIFNGLAILVILLLANPANSLDTGDLKSGFKEINLPIEISIKLWGFDDISSDLIPILDNTLPKNIVGESVYPSEDKIDQQVMFIRDRFWGIQNKITYNLETMASNEHNNLLDNIPYYLNNDVDGGMTAEYFDNVIIEQSGFVIDMGSFSNYLKPYNNENGYTLHLLNFTEIDSEINNTNAKHWFRLGNLKGIIDQDDIRNVGIVGKTGLFYDPSASAPHFDPSYFENSNMDNLLNTLSIRITELVENIFVGSPININYNFLNPIVHFDQVLIGPRGPEYIKVNTDLDNVLNSGKEFDKILSNLFPYLQVSGKFIQINNLEDPIFDYIKSLENEDSNSTGTYIKITNQIAEQFKNKIRTEYHEEWPVGFYFMSIIFLDSKDRKFIWNTVEGEKEYEYGEIGFGILNLADWRSMTDVVAKSRMDIKQLGLKNFGQIMGLPIYTNKFASQIDSPMSDYGFTDNSSPYYSEFERDSVARRLGAYYNNSAIHSLNALRADLKGGAFRWMDRSSLNDAEVTLEIGNFEYAQGNYTGAAELYIKGYEDWIVAKDDLTELQGAFYNGIELIAIVLVLLYLISTLKLFTLNKKQFYDNI